MPVLMKIQQLSVLTMPGCSLGIRDWRILSANDYFYSDVEPLSKYSLVMFHLE